MNKIIFAILFLIFCSGSGFSQGQCTPAIVCNPTTGCAPLEVIFNVPSLNGPGVYWSAGTMTAMGSTTSMTFATPGVYTVTVVVPCAPTMTILGTNTISISVVTGSANGCSTTVAGIRELNNKNDFSIYPNPSNGIFKIDLSIASEDKRVLIFNSLGQMVFEEKLHEKVNSINCQSLSKGIYNLVLVEKGMFQVCKKLLIVN